MPRLTRIYTRTGDDGDTMLGSGERVPKDSLRIESYGTSDELNSALGVAMAASLDEDVEKVLRPIQNDLLHLGADLCIPDERKSEIKAPCMEARHVKALEDHLDRFTDELEPLENFLLPGGSPGSAHLHLARCICRRAERLVIALSRNESVSPFVIQYLNRLSDLLFVLARVENKRKGCADPIWDSRA